MKKALIALMLLLGLSAGLWYLASPYIALYKLSSALEKGDAKEASNYVDYDLLKEDLKKDLKDLFAKELAKENYDEATGLLALAFGGLFIDAFVELAVSPEGLAYILESGRMPTEGEDFNPQMQEQEQNTLAIPEENKSINANMEKEQVETKAYYKGINTFVYSIRDKETKEGIDLLFERRGFASWKLVGMDFHFTGQ